MAQQIRDHTQSHGDGLQQKLEDYTKPQKYGINRQEAVFEEIQSLQPLHALNAEPERSQNEAK